MKGILVAKECKILSLTAKDNDRQGADRIEWTECIYLQGDNVNQLTIDKKAVELTAVGCVENLLIQVTENPKAYRNGNGAYIENKLKIVGVEGKKPTSKPSFLPRRSA